MFTVVLSWLRGAFNVIVFCFQSAWTIIRSFTAWVIATVIGLIAITDTVIKFVLQILDAMGYGVGYLLTGQNTGIIAGWINEMLGTINLFFPLTEAFTLLSAYSIILFSAWTYRAIKSWIPTVA
jgi:hypothetical protein